MSLANFQRYLALGLVVGLAGCNTTDQVATSSAPLTQEQVRLRILDACVYTEWSRPERRPKAAENCQCASKAAVRSLPAEDKTKMGLGRRLTSSQKAALDAGMRQCTA